MTTTDDMVPRGLAWRVSVWLMTALLSSTVFILLSIRSVPPFGAWPLLAGVAIGFVVAWLLGLLRARTAGIVKAAVVLGSLLAPFGAILLLAGVYEVTTVTDPPPMLSGVDLNLDWPKLDKALAVSLHRQYPPGTPEMNLLADLKSQHFAADGARRTASYRWQNPACSFTFGVKWSVTARQTLKTVSGDLEYRCL
jgi:hypothetical protein